MSIKFPKWIFGKLIRKHQTLDLNISGLSKHYQRPMPQLKLAWWLFNFIIVWIRVIIVLTIFLKKKISPRKIKVKKTSDQRNSNLTKWLWN